MPRTHSFSMYRPIILIALVCAFAPSSWASPDFCGSPRLPPKVDQILKHQFRDWKPKLFSDLSSDDQRVWNESHPRACPGIVSGHFEAADRMAYAILLVPKSAHGSGSKIIVISQASQGYAVRLLVQDQGSGPDSGLFISKAHPGAYSDFEDSRTIHLKLEAVEVEWLEKSSTLYYWSNGRYRSISTSD